MKYIQKPSPDLPDDTVVAVFYKNVWNVFRLREYQNNLIKQMYFQKPHGKSDPLIINMAYYKQFSFWEQAVNGINDFFQQLKKRASDSSLVEILLNADVKMPDSTVLVKIYGDIWKNGPLFREYPDR